MILFLPNLVVVVIVSSRAAVSTTMSMPGKEALAVTIGAEDEDM